MSATTLEIAVTNRDGRKRLLFEIVGVASQRDQFMLSIEEARLMQARLTEVLDSIDPS